MDQLMEFLTTIGDISWLVTRRELRRLRDSVLVGIAVAAFFILPGAFLGGVNLDLKMVWLGIGMVVIAGAVISLAYYRTPGGLTLGAAIDEAIAKRPGLVTTVAGGGRRYVRFVAGFLTSELGAGLIAFWLPGHQYPVMTLFLIPITMVIITYVIWKGGSGWWPKLVWRLTIATLVIAVAAIFLPRLSRLVMARAGRIEDRILCVIEDTRPECPRSAPRAAQPTSVSTYTLRPGQLVYTKEQVGDGFPELEFQATKSFVVWAAGPGGLPKKYDMPAGSSGWRGAGKAGPLKFEVDSGESVVQVWQVR